MSSMVTSSTSASTDEPEVRLAKCAFADAEIARLRQELEAQKASTAAFRDHLPKFHGVAIGALGKLVNYAKRNDILKKNNSALRKHAAKMAKVHDKIVQGYNPAELARLSRSVLSSLEEDEDMPPLPGRARTAGEGAGESTGEGAGESTGEEAGESAEAASHEEAIALLELLINEQTTGPHQFPLPLPRPTRAPAVRVRRGSGSGNGRGSASIDAETEAFNSRFASLITRSTEEAEAGAASSILGKKRDSVRKQQAEMQLKKAEVMKRLKREVEIEEEGEGEDGKEKEEEENGEVDQKKSKTAANKKAAVMKSTPATPAKNLIQLMLEEDEAGASIPKKRRIKIELETRDDYDRMTSSSSSAPSAPKVAIPKKKVEFSLFRVKQEMASDDEE